MNKQLLRVVFAATFAVFMATVSLSADGYTTMDLIDFKTDRSALKNHKIEVHGYITAFADSALLMTQIGDMAGVFVDVSKAPRDDRRRLAACANVCRVTVQGIGGKVMMQDGIRADRLIFE